MAQSNRDGFFYFVDLRKEESLKMIRKPFLQFFLILILALVLWGCPKKVIVTPPTVENPIVRVLENFSPFESLQARTSIRIDTVRNGEEMNFLLNGYLLYQKPNLLRLLGYHPLGMGLFDAIYRDGEFFLLIPFQKTVYTGAVSEFEDLIERAGPIEIQSERLEGSEIPRRIRIHVIEKETRIEIRLRDPSLNASLPEDTFRWSVPEGVEVRSLDHLLRKKRLR
ncbi:MAG: LolA family protein [Thermodesulfobacteriota bacterium]